MESPFKFDPREVQMKSTEALLHMHSKVVEQEIMTQLGELVKRKALTLEMGELTLVKEPASMELKIMQKVRLTLRDREYVEKLEKENKELREIVTRLQGVLK